MSDDLLQRAIDLSLLAKPPLWRIFKRWDWFRHHQPKHYLTAFILALHGDQEPLAKLGIAE